jgi:hypothetical protein
MASSLIMNEAVKRLVNIKNVEGFWYGVDEALAFEDKSDLSSLSPPKEIKDHLMMRSYCCPMPDASVRGRWSGISQGDCSHHHRDAASGGTGDPGFEYGQEHHQSQAGAQSTA